MKEKQMAHTYTTAVKTQVFLKAVLAGMDVKRIEDTLTVTAPEGYVFNNGNKVVEYEGKLGMWPTVYGKALTEISKPLIPAPVKAKRFSLFKGKH